MPLPTEDEALQRIHELAEAERLDVSRRARIQMDRLGYKDADVCDMLYELTSDCWDRPLEESHWEPNIPTATFITEFCSEAKEEENLPPDRLFVEVAIRADHLYLRACKLDGCPE